WVFGAGGIAYGLMPLILADATGEFTTLYATLMAVLTLGVGGFVQPFAQRIDRKLKGRALPLGLGVVVIGIALAALKAYQANPFLRFFTAIFLGVVYGSVFITGTDRVHMIAPGQSLAALTGLFYALTCFVFPSPTCISALVPVMPDHVTLLIYSALA